MLNKTKVHLVHREPVVHSELIWNPLVGLEALQTKKKKNECSTNIKGLSEMFTLIHSIRAWEKYKKSNIVWGFRKITLYGWGEQ